MTHTIIISNSNKEAETLGNLLKATCSTIRIDAIETSTEKAINSIHSMKPDLLLIDIDLNETDVFNMLESIRKIDFEIIFLSSNPQQALQAIPYGPISFILKPYSENDINQAILKAQEKINFEMKQQQVELEKTKHSSPQRIVVPDATGYSFMEVNKIMRIESTSNASLLVLENKNRIQVNKTLKEFEEILGDDFFRIHQSHIINLNHAKKYLRGNGGYIVMTDGTEMEVSRRRKEEVLSRMAWL